MACVNQGTILGRVGKIDTKTASASGVKITDISIVTSKKFVKNGEKQEKITWHNVTLFSKLAEIAEKYVSVGDLLYVQGEMNNQKYTTQDGQERVKHYIIGHDIQLMPKTKEKEHAAAPKDKSFEAGIVDDEIPW